MLKITDFLKGKKSRALAVILVLCIVLTIPPVIPASAGNEGIIQSAAGLPGSDNDQALQAISTQSADGISAASTPTSLSAEFEDPIFCAYVLDTVFENNKDGDDLLDDAAKAILAAVTELDVSELGISNLKGIRHFTGLEDLNVNRNSLTSLDLTFNLSLENINVNRNSLTSLDLTFNLSLENINVSDNQLTALTLPYSDALLYINADNNELTSLDISHNPNLEELFVSNNNLTGLNLTKNIALEQLGADSNQLTSLDISSNIKLGYLSVSDNKISGSLDVTNNTALWYLDVRDNYMASDNRVIGWITNTNLRPDHTFFFNPQKTTPPDPPEPPEPPLTPPTGLSYDGNGNINWVEVVNAEWYHIYIEGLNGNKPMPSDKYSTTFNLVNFLQTYSYTAPPGGQLKIQVTAFRGTIANPESESSRSDQITVAINALTSPVISLQADKRTLQWASVAGSNGYILYSDGNIHGSYLTTSVDLTALGLDPGKHKIEVRAIANGTALAASRLSNTVEYTTAEGTGTDGDPGPGGPTVEVEINPDWSVIRIKDGVPSGSTRISAFQTFPSTGKTLTGEPGTFSIANPNGYLTQIGEIVTITVTFTADADKSRTATKDFSTKVQKQLIYSMISVSGIYEYTGSQIIPTYTISDGSLLKSSDYTVSISNNINAGTASISVQATASGNYYGLAIREFPILRATPAGTPLITPITSAGKTLADTQLALPAGGFKNPRSGITVPGVLLWEDGLSTPVTEKTIYRWTFVPTDIRNYYPVSGTFIPPDILEMESKTTEYGKVFRDVPQGVWYEDSVTYMFGQSLMKGTSEDPMLFSPNVTLSRAMIVTILYRNEGEPSTAGFSNPFSDIPENTWYTKAVVWMAENGIVNGYPDRSFAPNDNIKRQDLAAILIRYADFKEQNLPKNKQYKAFVDDSAIADYAKDAVLRCFEAGIINGKDGNIFDPHGNATRAEAAAMLYRYLTL